MKLITIIGNLGANAIRRTTADGRELMSFNVAVNSGNNQPPIWFNCIGNMREKLLPFLVKGQCVCVCGDLSARMYNNNIDLSISIDRVELCGAKPEENNSSQQAPGENNSSQQAPVSESSQSFDAAQQQML